MQIPASACSILEKSFEDVTLVEFMYLVSVSYTHLTLPTIDDV